MAKGGPSTRTPAAPQVTGVVLGSLALSAGWSATDSLWRGVLVGVTAGLAAYAVTRRQRAKADRATALARDATGPVAPTS